MLTRVAPTPSGYLHDGNAVNALLISWLARQRGASVVLRIDDIDAPRYRREYVEDLIDVLRWLHVDWDAGPQSASEFEADFSLARKSAYYRSELGAAVRAGLPVFACSCSRSQSRASGVRGCVGDCSARSLALVPGETAMRSGVEGTEAAVLWRRDDLPAYHLASLVEDRDHGTTHVVRGEDLREATAVQRALAPYFGASDFAEAEFLHHPLLAAPDGSKLSKSQSAAGPLPRTSEHLATLIDVARSMAGPLGVVAPPSP